MFPAQFEYHSASTVPEALALLGQYPEAKLLAGGHSLLPLIKLRLAQPGVLVDIGRIKELRGIHEQGDRFTIGALTTHYEVESSELLKQKCAILPEAAAWIGDLQVRNRGTVGGSLSHADPAADLPAVMLALGAEIVATGPNGERTIRADDFFTGLLTTALAENEILTAVRVPLQPPGRAGAYVKHPHPASHYAIVGVAVVASLRDGNAADLRIGVTGASDHAYRAMATEGLLNGKPFNAENIAAAAEKAAQEGEMMSDATATAEFRAHLVQVYTRRALTKLRERLG